MDTIEDRLLVDADLDTGLSDRGNVVAAEEEEFSDFDDVDFDDDFDDDFEEETEDEYEVAGDDLSAGIEFTVSTDDADAEGNDNEPSEAEMGAAIGKDTEDGDDDSGDDEGDDGESDDTE